MAIATTTTGDPVTVRAKTAAGGMTAARRRRRLSQLTRRDTVILAAMVGVPTLIQAVVVWIPVLASIGLSFTKWNGIDPSRIEFTGLSNYQFIFTEYTPFWAALAHNAIWMLFLACVATPLGLALAVLLDQQLRGSRIYQSVFFLPVMMSLALVGIIWQLVYDRDQGILNILLGTAGTEDAALWLGDSSTNLWAALIATTWRHAGYVMILYLAGLKGVDPSLKEAAALDGANARVTFFQVTFPAMRPMNIVIVVITIVESLRAFDLAWVINKGRNGLELINTLIIQNLVGEGQVIGIGSALAVVLLVASLVPIVFYLRRAFRNEESHDTH